MERRLFLTGPSGCGKSALIREALGERVKESGGFRTVREMDENGDLVGVDLLPPDGSGWGRRFLERTEKGTRLHLEVFRNTGVEYLRSAGQKKFAVLDEVGGAELLDEEFLNALSAFLKSGQPCIGVMEGPWNMGKLMGTMGLKIRYELVRRALVEYMKHDPDTRVVEVKGPYDEDAKAQVAQWVELYT